MAATIRAVPQPPAARPTRAEVVELIRALVGEIIAPRSGWTNDDGLRDLGIDSMEEMELAMSIEDALEDRRITIVLEPGDNPEAWRTVNTIADFVMGRIER